MNVASDLGKKTINVESIAKKTRAHPFFLSIVD